MDDTSDLSSAEEIALFNRHYNKISRKKPWEGLKTSATGTLSTSVPYVSIAADFAFFLANGNYTSASEYGAGPAVLVGTDYRPYKIVNWSDRRQYRERTGFAYFDFANDRLQFTQQPVSAESYEYDYIKVPTALGASDEPWFPYDDFHAAIAHSMAEESFMIQQTEKGKSYAKEQAFKYQQILAEMEYWNANLIQID
jgi:hypothetical protein